MLRHEPSPNSGTSLRFDANSLRVSRRNLVEKLPGPGSLIHSGLYPEVKFESSAATWQVDLDALAGDFFGISLRPRQRRGVPQGRGLCLRAFGAMEEWQ